MGQMSAAFEEESAIVRKPVSFTHQPFLLLKITPTSFFEADKNFRYGVEVAPPFGKFSFAFDYGKGKGNGIWRDSNEGSFSFEESNKQYRGELKMYFSDWYPFYALDKKPFGRYYSIEYVHKILNAERPINPAYLANSFELPIIAPRLEYDPLNTETLEQAVNLKIGKHWHLTRFLFVDTFAGLGLGVSKTTPLSTDFDIEEGYKKQKFSFSQPVREVGSKSWFLSKTAGIKLCLVL